MGDANPQLRGLSVFIAEDDPRIARLLVDLIEIHGGVVAGRATNTQKAQKIIETAVIDVAILDIKLKDKACFLLADELIRRNVAVILITGYARSEIPETYAQLPTFTKPFRIATLLECLTNSRPTRSVRPA